MASLSVVKGEGGGDVLPAPAGLLAKGIGAAYVGVRLKISFVSVEVFSVQI